MEMSSENARSSTSETNGVVRRAVIAVLIALLAFCESRALAQPSEPISVPVAKQATEEIAATPMPPRLAKIYAGDVPSSAADLHLMDAYQQKLVKKLTAATVAIQVGPTQGSGVVVTADGYVLTASHVARRPGMRARIILSDGRQVRGTTLGMNKNIDAGLIKIDTSPAAIGKPAWPHAAMGQTASLRRGSWCLTIGHAGGFQPDRMAPTVRLGRILHISKRAIETDCTLVGGDSGGPLFDMQGHVIGINSRIGADLDKNIHVPIDTFRVTWNRLTSGESWGDLANIVGRPKPAAGSSKAAIGVMRPANSDDPKVETVLPNSPAERAGIQSGDMITRFDGAPVTSFSQLAQLVQQHEPGDEVSMELRRSGRLIKIKLVLGVLVVPKPK